MLAKAPSPLAEYGGELAEVRRAAGGGTRRRGDARDRREARGARSAALAERPRFRRRLPRRSGARGVSESRLRARFADESSSPRRLAERCEVRGRGGAHDRAHARRAACTRVADGERIVGTVTSGGTESILLAMKTYRDRARARGIRRAEIVAPASAHAAFDKAAELLRMTLVRVPVASDFRADVRAMRRAITRRTVVLVGSAPGFPHGVVDPDRRALGARARARRRAPRRRLPRRLRPALGAPPRLSRAGFRLFARRRELDVRRHAQVRLRCEGHVGRPLPRRRAPAVSVLRERDWPGGLYFSPTLAGSRSGRARRRHLGGDGEHRRAWLPRRDAPHPRDGRERFASVSNKSPSSTCSAIRSGSSRSPPTRIDIYRVLDAMSARGWSLNGLQRPPSVHLCVTLRHTEPGVADRFLGDLGAAVDDVKASPPTVAASRPSTALPVRSPFAEQSQSCLRRFVDKLYGS